MKMTIVRRLVWVAVCTLLLTACSDNSNAPMLEERPLPDAATGDLDGATRADEGAPDGTAPDRTVPDDQITPDSGTTDSGGADSGATDSAVLDMAGATDRGRPDMADADADADAVVDAAVVDAAVVDAAVVDAAVVDAAVVDAAVVDSELIDMRVFDAQVVDAELENPARPLTPTACSNINRGDCACNDDEGFTTYTWWVADQQRCATTYVPQGIQGTAPVLISNDCYSSNGLGQCRSGSEMVAAADRFGFVGLCTTSADGNWTFGNDGEINDNNPTPCSAEDSKDITYMNGVFSIVDALGAENRADTDSVYAWGFSQNAMFTAYMSFCNPDRIKGFWQGGSGLFVRGETDPLPQMEGVCRKSDYEQYGRQCVQQAPCDGCQYFPIYPVSTAPPLNGCIMAYADDYLSETAAPMARLMTEEGHNATLLNFPAIGRGHSTSLIHWDWMVGCMAIVSPCSAACSAAVIDCVEVQNGNSAQVREGHYNGCLSAGLADCQASCAPTLEMLRVVERPCLVDGVCDNGETQATCAVDCGGGDGGNGDGGNGDVEQLPSCDELNRPVACCGDTVCDGPENAENCVVDCAANSGGEMPQLASCIDLNQPNMCCGDNVCDGPENAQNCIVDCR